MTEQQKQPMPVSEKEPVAANFSGHDKAPFDSSESDTRSTEIDEDIKGDYGSYRNHVFTDPEVAKYWTDVMHKASYEGRHRFDPEFTWSATEEKKVKRKVRPPCYLSFDFADSYRLTSALCEQI